MDVIVVVVFYVNTGRPTQLRQSVWLNLRLDSFSKPDARPQELCERRWKCPYSPRQTMVFASRPFFYTRSRAPATC
jgi:hypothetical protein